jgi:hypothetical protein
VNENPGANFDNTAATSGVYSIAFNLGAAYSGATPWYNQTGVPIGTSSRRGVAGMWIGNNAVTAYHFFAHDGGDNVYCVVERTSGVYTYFGFGELIKHGAYTGGRFFFGAQSGVATSTATGAGFLGLTSSGNGTAKGYISVDVDAEAGWHWGSSSNWNSRDTTKRYVRDSEADNIGTILQQPNTHNGLSLIMPVAVCVERDTGHGATSPTSSIGEFPQMGSFIISPAIIPGQQVTYGSDDYRVFPFYVKSNADYRLDLNSHSGFRGWAIKE